MTAESFTCTDAEIPPCPKCGKPPIRPGHRLEIERHDLSADVLEITKHVHAFLVCMWCSSAWALVGPRGGLKLRKLTEPEWVVAAPTLVPAQLKFAVDRMCGVDPEDIDRRNKAARQGMTKQ